LNIASMETLRMSLFSSFSFFNDTLRAFHSQNPTMQVQS
jgi:hypothetical protein